MYSCGRNQTRLVQKKRVKSVSRILMIFTMIFRIKSPRYPSQQLYLQKTRKKLLRITLTKNLISTTPKWTKTIHLSLMFHQLLRSYNIK